MKTPCIGCGTLIPVGQGGSCRSCSPRRYRSSRAWTDRSRAVRAGARCAVCGSDGPLEVHHMTQLAGQLRQGVQGELVPLCRPCHRAEHAPRRS